MSIKNFTEMLETLLSLKWEDIPEGTIHRTKWMIADTLFAAWYGTSAPEIQKYIESVGSLKKDAVHTFPIVGTNYYTTPANSAIIHGTAIVSNELDEGNQFAKGHPAAHLFAPSYIAAVENEASGQEFIHAFIIGYEVAARLAYASNINDDMHPHGTWGIVGGTTAAGIIQKKNNQEILESVLLAASFPIATSWQAAITGMTVRNLYTGLGSMHAIHALQFQSYGFHSSTGVVDHLWGSIMSEGINYELFQKDLWSPPLLDKNYFKLYPSCRFTHSAIDALLDSLQEKEFDVSEISSVFVETYGLAARLGDPDPQNALAAKFSIPYVLSALLHGKSLYESDKEPVFSDPSIRELAKRITVKEDPNMTALLPNKRAARVTLTLKNGSRESSFVEDASGGYNQPLPEDRLVEKFKNMLAQAGYEKIVESVIKETMALDQTNQISEWSNSFSKLTEGYYETDKD